MCVQRFDDSLNSAIHITYRISLRSSSMLEPRDPLLKVFNDCVLVLGHHGNRMVWASGGRGPVRRPVRGSPGPAKATEVGRHGVKSRGPKPPGARGPISVMILPQVHLRKPCYDFYFL